MQAGWKEQFDSGSGGAEACRFVESCCQFDIGETIFLAQQQTDSLGFYGCLDANATNRGGARQGERRKTRQGGSVERVGGYTVLEMIE